ncbi:MAG TPA: glycogen synthase GlgA [Planctomycetes bacterium]|nr:glycogen synthase GlgA [Planctomycetota bacterium]
MAEPRVLFCASEMTPFAKTGGLADVAGALPPALKRIGVDVHCVLPLYGVIDRNACGIAPAGKGFTVKLDIGQENFTLHRADREGVPVHLLECDHLFDRGGLYGEKSCDYPDNCRRFALFSLACLELADYLGLDPDIVHVHDWQTALIPVYMRTRRRSRARSLLTIHNLAFQGIFPPGEYHWTGLDWSLFDWQKLEYYGKVNFLKGGIVYADAVSTVSPAYAREIRRTESGCGLEGVLVEKGDRLCGILNGIDPRDWDPATDVHLPARFSAGDLAGKQACRALLMKEAGLAPTPHPLLGTVGRLTEQKGLDILLPALATLLGEGCPFVILGTGDAAYEAELRKLARLFPGRLGLFLAFDNRLAHLIEAGCDMFVMPSRFEPCGLNQFYSMRYGAVPIVRATGGLADSVAPWTPGDPRAGTGFAFSEYTPAALLAACREAIAVFADKDAWLALMRNGMQQDVGWSRSAENYRALYRSLVESGELMP